MLVPALKKVAYDPSRFIDVETVDEAVNIILTPEAGQTSKQRWDNETPALLQIIEKFINEPRMSVLDYGCGIGRLAKPLVHKHNCLVVGVDISPNMRALATSLVDSPDFFVLDPVMLPEFIKWDWFEVALAIWTLQHIADPQEAIDNIADALLMGGRFIVVNNDRRAIPIEHGEWGDDGLDVKAMILNSGFKQLQMGQLDETIAPGRMRDETFWAVYEKV